MPGGIDPSRAYLCKLPSGRSIALFFYDGIVSQQVAFERLLDQGDRFLWRDSSRGSTAAANMPSSCISPPTANPTAITIRTATWRWPTCSIGWPRITDVRLTNYGEFLELHPPTWEVEIHENSSWSCVPWHRTMAIRLRLQDVLRLAPEMACAAARGARLAEGRA